MQYGWQLQTPIRLQQNWELVQKQCFVQLNHGERILNVDIQYIRKKTSNAFNLVPSEHFVLLRRGRHHDTGRKKEK